MKVLVGCEFSGTVRRAFAAKGHEVFSCDLLPSDDESPMHIIGDLREFLPKHNWDLAILHPPCTRLCLSGVRWLHKPPKDKTIEQMWQDLENGAEFFSYCLNAPVEKLCVENPRMHRYAKERIKNYFEPETSVQPWQHGHPTTKETFLWLKNLPTIFPTNIVRPRRTEVHYASPGPDRWKFRSKTYQGIANAMAQAWG